MPSPSGKLDELVGSDLPSFGEQAEVVPDERHYDYIYRKCTERLGREPSASELCEALQKDW
jgi:hypothetical protein